MVRGAISPENRGRHFRIALKNLDFGGRYRRPKKEARPKGPGKPLLVAPQYSQKSPKNNALFCGPVG
jgi:hypothetical protein